MPHDEAVSLTPWSLHPLQMSWHPQYRSSKFRHVYGKPASKENCYDSVPITRSVHDNHFCAVNPHFIAVVTECAGGGAFLVIPLHQVRTLVIPGPRLISRAYRTNGKGREPSLGVIEGLACFPSCVSLCQPAL